MEYALFGLGVIIVVVSLFINHKERREQDGHYVQSELLSEIREVKDRLEERLKELNADNFQQILDEEVEDTSSNQNFDSALNSIQDKIVELEEKIDRLESKINYSLSNTVGSTVNSTMNKDRAENVEEEENETYQKIKNLMEEGLSLAEVAQKLDMGTREVRLIWKFNARGEEE
ncbi:MAG: hypothetical protein R6V17_05745 [Halanaerobacter sp.]